MDRQTLDAEMQFFSKLIETTMPEKIYWIGLVMEGHWSVPDLFDVLGKEFFERNAQGEMVDDFRNIYRDFRNGHYRPEFEVIYRKWVDKRMINSDYIKQSLELVNQVFTIKHGTINMVHINKDGDLVFDVVVEGEQFSGGWSRFQIIPDPGELITKEMLEECKAYFQTNPKEWKRIGD